MKYLFLLLISFSAYAQFVNLEICGSGQGTGVFSHKETCESDTGSTCVPYHGGACDYMEAVDNIIQDGWTKNNEESCNDKDDCELKFQALSCGSSWEKIKNDELLSVYCVKPVMKVDGKKLVESQVKKAAHEAKLLAERDAVNSKQAKCQAFKNANIDAMPSLAALKPVIKLWQECQK